MQKAIKNTAAVLHPLHEKDREWILANLTPVSQSEVRSALKGLKKIKSLKRVKFDEIYDLVKPAEVSLIEAVVPKETALDTLARLLDVCTIKKGQDVVVTMSPESLAQLLPVMEHSKLRHCIASSAEPFSRRVKEAEKNITRAASERVIDSMARYMNAQLEMTTTSHE
ncbi:hypothetical protein A9Q81_07635 [Gammaproteobacteria bacterium 42_54_T18]|nr:hypothetical protein A9Q81_07635 [Gammaproteobacteria bacterium 42_54_T18]